MAWKRVALIMALVFSGGCYEYHTVRPADAVLNTRVRATVTSERAADLEPVLRGVRSEVTGKLIERTSDHLMLEVPIYGTNNGASNRALNNRIQVKLSDLVSLQTRTLSTWRTAVAVGVVAVAAAGTWTALNSANETGVDKPGTGTNNSFISLFRIPLSLFH